MQDNKKRFLPLIAIFTLVFAISAGFMLFNMFNRDSDKENALWNVFKRRDSYIEVLETELKCDIKADKPLDVLTELGYEGIIIPRKYQKYYKPCFDFVITNEGIKITKALAKEFYNYDWQLGDIITKIGDKELKNIDYFDIFELIYTKEEKADKTFTLKRGNEVNYRYDIYHNRVEVMIDGNKLCLKLYDLDVTTAKYVYDLMTEKEYDEIILDLSQATVNEFNSLYQYLSLFVEGKTVLFTKPENIKALHMHKAPANVKISVGNNRDSGIHFLQTAIRNLNNDIIIAGGYQLEKFNLMTKYQDSSYDIYLCNNELLVSGYTTNGGVEI